MEPKFLATDDIGRLARWLRLMGYDVVSVERLSPSALYQKAYNERRIVLTRNTNLTSGSLVRVAHLESQLLEEQLRQLVRDIPLQTNTEQAFTRCDRCNVPVEPIAKADVEDRVPLYVYQTQERFDTCPSCHRIYWAATHWQRAQRLFARVSRPGETNA